MNKREEIIQLAISFIKKYSFQELSFGYLAEQLNITKAAIHYYFKNKTDLGIAICEHLEEMFKQQQLYFEQHSELSAYQSLEKRIAFLSDGEICPAVSLQSDLNKYDEALQKKVIELAEVEYHTYVQILARKMDLEQAQILAQAHLASIKGARIYNRTLAIPFEQTILERVKKEINEVERT